MQDATARQIDAFGLTDRVMLTGGLNAGDLAAAFASAAVFCLPSVPAAEMYGVV